MSDTPFLICSLRGTGKTSFSFNLASKIKEKYNNQFKDIVYASPCGSRNLSQQQLHITTKCISDEELQNIFEIRNSIIIVDDFSRSMFKRTSFEVAINNARFNNNIFILTAQYERGVPASICENCIRLSDKYDELALHRTMRTMDYIIKSSINSVQVHDLFPEFESVYKQPITEKNESDESNDEKHSVAEIHSCDNKKMSLDEIYDKIFQHPSQALSDAEYEALYSESVSATTETTNETLAYEQKLTTEKVTMNRLQKSMEHMNLVSSMLSFGRASKL